MLTLLIAVVGCFLVIFFRPALGLAVYVIVSMWYPYCVGTISIGSIDFSVGRIVIIALFFKIFFSTNLVSNFKVILLDKLIIILFVAELVAGLANVDAMKLL